MKTTLPATELPPNTKSSHGVFRRTCQPLGLSALLGLSAFNAWAALFPPAITTQPVSAVVTMGQPASLSVANTGTAPFGYQWLKDGVLLNGQTNSSVSFASFQFTNSG
ncbi:MAG: immunoglobulin domain-containing protein, partial [Verrucomicrobiota bacterium]